jgi:hypothetical protein
VIRRWKRSEDGPKVPVDLHRQIRPWWRTDGTGNLVLVLRSGLKTLELEKGKPAVVVGPPERLVGVIETLVAATKAGELDAALEVATDAGERGIPKRKVA